MRSRPSVVHLPPAPSLLPSLVAWYDASDAGSITSSSGLVSQWDDLSGAGHHLTAAGSNRPLTGVDTVNGLNAIRFAGNIMASTLSAILSPISWFAVVKFTNFAGDGAIVGASGSGGLEWRANQTSGTQLSLKQGVAGIGSSGTGIGTSAVRIGMMHTNAGAWYMRLAGALDGSGTSAVTLSGGATMNVGAQFNQTSEAMAADLCELVGCNADIAGLDLASIESYYAAKWNTP